MISLPSGLGGKGSFAHGVHPREAKEQSEHEAIRVLPTPKTLALPVLQHVGAACEPTVKTKTEVAMGDVVASCEAFISAPVHASLGGTIGRESVTTLPNGRRVRTVSLTVGEGQPEGRTLWDDQFGGHWTTAGMDRLDPAQITAQVRAAGIVGQGGAAFPTFVKLLRNEKKPVDTVLLNGCECEPYLTADFRVMVEAAPAIVSGALLAARAAGATQVVVALEDNKPEAVEALRTAANGTSVKVAVVKTKYPMGGEKQTVRAVLGRTIPTGGLPLDVGVVVINVATAAAVARAVLRERPLTHRVVTVTGEGIAEPANLLAPVGASYRDLIDACGGCTEAAVRVVAGGPMMGFTLFDLDTPITKGTSGITVLTEKEVYRAAETACVRCGRCVEVCPLGLVPSKIALAARNGNWELAKRYHMAACMECGCCAYTCPASLPLVQLIRMGKVEARKG